MRLHGKGNRIILAYSANVGFVNHGHQLQCMIIDNGHEGGRGERSGHRLALLGAYGGHGA